MAAATSGSCVRASDGIKSNRVVMEKGGGGADGLNGGGGGRHSLWCIAEESIHCSFDKVLKRSLFGTKFLFMRNF